MQNVTKYSLLVLFCFFEACINFSVQPYKTFDPGQLPDNYIPVWEPANAKQPSDVNFPVIENKFDTAASLLCFVDFNVIYKEADDYLRKENFNNITQLQNNITAAKEETVNKGGIINHNLMLNYIQPIKFNNSNIPKSVSLKISSTSEVVKPTSYDPGRYVRELTARISSSCEQKVIAGFGFAGKSREPITNDEKEIFAKFGLDGLKFVDAIDGKTNIESIISKTNLSKEKIREIINYLIENNFLKSNNPEGN
ncbi:hypothetical protein ACFLSQ_10325 [Bacteroidota bacterium]